MSGRAGFTLRIGAMSPPIAEQLAEQGIAADKGWLATWQEDADAIVRLHLRGRLSAAEKDRACRRLLRAIGGMATPTEAAR